MEKICSIGEGRAFTKGMRALLIVAACGCNHLPVSTAAAATAAPREPTVPMLLVPQETMEFAVTFRGMKIATVQTAIGKAGWVEGKRAIIVKSRGKTDGLIALLGDLRWELESTIDLDRGYPLHDHEEAWAELAGEKNHDDDSHDWTADDDRHDLHSAIGTLRGWHPTPGEEREVRVHLGGSSFGVTVAQAGRARLVDRPALRYDGVANGDHKFSIWISDDASRVPLASQTETELGTVAVELVDYGALRD
jgi:hypothetical protein